MESYERFLRPYATWGIRGREITGGEIHRLGCEYLRLVELSDALAISAIGKNFEVVTNAPSLGSLRGEMEYPHPVCAPNGGGEGV